MIHMQRLADELRDSLSDVQQAALLRAFMGVKDSLAVVAASPLTASQKNALLVVLSANDTTTACDYLLASGDNGVFVEHTYKGVL